MKVPHQRTSYNSLTGYSYHFINSPDLFISKKSIYKALDVPIHNSFYISHLETRPVIFDQGIRLENIGSDLTSPSDLGVASLYVFDFFSLFFFFDLNKLTFQKIHCSLSILDLATFCLTCRNNPSWYVGDPYGRVGLINVLASCSTRPVGVYP